MKKHRERPAGRAVGAESIVPLLVAAATFLIFSGVLRNGFLNWDDPTNFLQNPHYRGLGWTQIRWMFTSSLGLGHYMPLTWLTFGLDFTLWGMDPFGYHLTNLLLHCANAAVFYFVSRRLLALSAPAGETTSARSLDFFAGLSAILFALHPLRVESVAWVTERRDVLSGFFCLLSILFYLQAGADPSKYKRRIALSVAFFAFSLLSKISAVTLPLALAVIDLYPSRRLPADPKLWFSPAARRVWLEKAPFVLLALPAGLLGISGQLRIGTLRSLAQWGAVQRLSVALYGAAFYDWKTVAPWSLSPFYPLPSKIDPLAAPFLLSGFFVFAVSVVAIVARRRLPAALAVWAWYLILLLPVSGLSQSGAQIAADRYTYLPCLGFALLTAGVFARLTAEIGGSARRISSVVAAFLVAALSALTWRENRAWRDSESLWRHALAISPDLPLAHNSLGIDLFRQKRIGEAIAQYDLALQKQPDFPEAHNNLGLALVAQGKIEEAIGQFDLALQERPDYAEAHNSIGQALAGQGKANEAMRHFDLALQERPDFPEAHNNLGLALAAQGKTDEAIRHYELALRTRPDFSQARYNLGLTMAGQGKIDKAIRQYDLSLQSMPDSAETHNNLGKILAEQGKLDEAIRQFELALKARPDSASAQNNLGLALARQGKLEEAIRHYNAALALDSKPELPFIHNNLAAALAQQGKTEEAIRHLRQALELKPGFTSVQENLSILLNRVRRTRSP